MDRLGKSMGMGSGGSPASVDRKRYFLGTKKIDSFLGAIAITSSMNNARMYVAGADKATFVHSMYTGELVGTLTGHKDRVLCVAVSMPSEVPCRLPVGKDSATFDAGAAVVGELESPKHGHASSWPSPVEHHRGDHFVVTGGRDEYMCIWDMTSNSLLHSIHAHKGPVWAVAAVLTKDGLGYAISSSNAGSIRVWDAVTGNRIFNLKGQRNKVLSLRLLDPRVYPNILLSGGEDKYVHVWNLTTGEPVRVMSGHEDEVTCLSSGEFPYASFAALYNCSPVSAKRTVAGSTVALSEPEMMDHATASSIVSSTNSVSSSRPSSESLEAGVAENCMNAASRDGTVMLIISGSRDKTIRIWDYLTGVCLQILTGHISALLAVSPAISISASIRCAADVPTLVTASDDGSLFIWNLETGKLLKETKGSANCVKGISSSLVLTAVRSTSPPPGFDRGAAAGGAGGGNKDSLMLVATCGWEKSVQVFDLDEALGEDQPQACKCVLS